MKIGLVVPSIPSYSETFFRNKIIELQKKGYEIVLFSVNKNKQEFDLCNVVYSPNLSNKFSVLKQIIIFIFQLIIKFKSIFKFYLLNKNDGFSTLKNIKTIFLNIHFFGHKLDWLHFGFATMAIDRENIAKAINAEMAVSFRGYDLYVYPVKFPKCYEILFSKKVKYHVLSNGMKKILLEKGVVDNTIDVISPAINHENFARSRKKNEANSTINIITIARLHWIKGLIYILEALAIAKKNGLKFQYTIIGAGIEEEKLRFAVHQLNITNEVIFAGKKKSKEINFELQKSDIYIQFSLQEGFCNAVLEAQSAGLLCIVSDADGLIENVIDNQTGWVVPKREPKLLAKKISEVINLTNNDKEKIKNNASQRILNQFNLSQQLDKFINFYEF